MRKIPLQKLLKKMSIPIPEGINSKLLNSDITNITSDSRKVDSGTLFIAMKGITSDGHNFLEKAHEKGAVAALVEVENPKVDIVQFQVKDTRELWGKSISILFDNPHEKMKFIGITGTNGKTTTSYIIEKILNDGGISTGIIGTIEYRYKGYSTPAQFTSPDPEILFPLLDNMEKAGVEIVIMEVSSHALAQERVKGLKFDAVLLTNFTQDHLDFHGDMEEYAKAKGLLFTKYITDDSLVVAWGDNSSIDSIIPSEKSKITYSIDPQSKCDWVVASHGLSINGIEGQVKNRNSNYHFKSPLIGEHNILNVLGAVILSGKFNIPHQKAFDSISEITVPGRLARVGSDLPVFVDYAHTPDALDHAQESIRSLLKGRLITVFGCGGDRDHLKRPLMGASVDSGSHIAVVTSDNPRTEDPGDIISHILPGIKSSEITKDELFSSLKGHIVIPNREDAIYSAILHASDEDAILIAGKGHENYQIIGKIKNHFDDSEEAQKALDARRKKSSQ
jgi:UDP-N-acetylmuramoyl-L-alanyl-D-glutamate--2,6-diaminopimelate ligase